MQQIINFVIRNKVFLLFLLLFGISLGLTIQSHSYHKSKFINSANFLTGGVYESADDITGYFNLREQNDILVEENSRLRQQLYNNNDSLEENTAFLDSTSYSGVYEFRSARVINNNYSNTKNYLTINVGKNDSVTEDLGVITSKGIVGIIDNTSKNYARVLSVLNTKSKINAQLKSTDHIGSLTWNGKSPQVVQMIDVSKFAPVKQGDTITTGGQSAIFPKGIPIGKIDSFVLDPGGDTYTITVSLFNDMTSLAHAYVIKNIDAAEIRQLENPIDE
ncbi:rod shape-determining protein MreC [Sediminibacter sp. Hel_I_10]|uniref:rod shape-determining protein MreC n=1 Tax=Sediminibacter sp. Hel_I_10 TaxID=1392490 RepID=UPI00047D7948|nr:rod shape-determining protein MreC [Sediminibacter sp. Hel_I_10]